MADVQDSQAPATPTVRQLLEREIEELEKTEYRAHQRILSALEATEMAQAAFARARSPEEAQVLSARVAYFEAKGREFAREYARVGPSALARAQVLRAGDALSLLTMARATGQPVAAHAKRAAENMLQGGRGGQLLEPAGDLLAAQDPADLHVVMGQLRALAPQDLAGICTQVLARILAPLRSTDTLAQEPVRAAVRKVEALARALDAVQDGAALTAMRSAVSRGGLHGLLKAALLQRIPRAAEQPQAPAAAAMTD